MQKSHQGKKKGKTMTEELTTLKPCTEKPADNPQLQFLHSSLSQRLQTENPFDEFREAVEKAILEKAANQKKTYSGDKDFFKEIDDTGMCLSMH